MLRRPFGASPIDRGSLCAPVHNLIIPGVYITIHTRMHSPIPSQCHMNPHHPFLVNHPSFLIAHQPFSSLVAHTRPSHHANPRETRGPAESPTSYSVTLQLRNPELSLDA